jgi:hypothetical protein
MTNENVDKFKSLQALKMLFKAEGWPKYVKPIKLMKTYTKIGMTQLYQEQ